MATTFGTELRRWRSLRRLSQLDLASAAGVSQRHISFLETGRARPSREMVIHLAATMDMPLRSCNGLLGVAGFAPAYPVRDLGRGDLGEIGAVLGRLLEAHGPYPAYIVDRLWNIQLGNAASTALVATLAPPVFRPDVIDGNALRLMLHPQGLRDVVANWETVAGVLVRRLRREADERPDDDALAALLTEMRDLSGGVGPGDPTAAADELLAPIVLRTGSGPQRFFTTIATIGGAHDVTLEELRIETLLPADEDAEAFLRSLDP